MPETSSKALFWRNEASFRQIGFRSCLTRSVFSFLGHAPSSHRFSPFLVCLCFVGLAVVATWPLLLHIDEALPGDLGDPLLNAWILGWDADRLRHGLSGLWDAPIYYPYRHTLAFSEHLLGIALPVAPLVWLTGRTFVAYNVVFIFSFALAGIGMWLLVRRLTGCGEAALVAGAIFAFAPVRFAHVGHIQVLVSGWMPIALWALHGYIDSGSRRMLAGVVAAFLVQALSNSYYIYFLTLPIAAVALHAFVSRHRTRRRLAIELAAGGLVVLAALTPIVLIYFDVRRAYGLRRSLDDVTNLGADLAAYFHDNEGLRAPIRLWTLLPHVDKPAGPEGELFPGSVALAFASVALWPLASRRAEPWVRLYAIIGVAALLLSLGARPALWGRPLPVGLLYRWLFAYLPGFDGLRVPARFSVVVLLAIAVLAGAGFLRVSRHWTARFRVAGAVAAAAFAWLEGNVGAMPLAFLKPHGRPDRAAYTWIRDHEHGALLELPAGELDTGFLTFQYEYQTLVHRHRIVNGATGYPSPLQTFLGSPASPLVEPPYFHEAVAMLRGIGIRTVVVHLEAFPASLGADIVELFRQESDQITSETRFPGMVMFGLAHPLDGSNRRSGDSVALVPSSEFRASASHANALIGRAFDGDPRTRWTSGTRQSGDERIEVTFDRPRDVGRIRFLTTDRSLGDYPRELVVEVSEELDRQPAPRRLFDGSIVAELARGLSADPQQGPVDIWLPPNRARRLTLRQVGQTRRWFWSIDELTFWERRTR